MNVVILGCSRVGALVAQWLESKGDQVTIIDWEAPSFARLGKEFKGKTILGTGIDIDILRKAKVDEADAFIAVTNSDNTNLMAAQVVKAKFKVSKVLIRVYGPKRAQAFKEIGLDIICPTVSMAEEIKQFLSR